jgi:hypothetical protein
MGSKGPPSGSRPPEQKKEVLDHYRALSPLRYHWGYLRWWTTLPVRIAVVSAAVLWAVGLAVLLLAGIIASAYVIAAGGVWIGVGTVLGLLCTSLGGWFYRRRWWLEPSTRYLARNRIHYGYPGDCSLSFLIHRRDSEAAVREMEATGFWNVGCAAAGQQPPPLDQYDARMDAYWMRDESASQDVRAIAKAALAAANIDARYASSSNC